MWLLSTDRAELRFFVSAESVPGGYAILSHVWDATEQSFQDLCKLRDECAGTGENPRDRTLAKIRDCCRLAERHGFQWLWVDTCCIDKTSSAELSEAINSMFHYYSLSSICYVYLRDVTLDAWKQSGGSALDGSAWHTRGWTLQELLAPGLVVFMSREWEFLGSKTELAPSLSRTTGVPESVLSLRLSLSDFSIAQRMSWAARRKTTRPEDEAYCLLGIFAITMPTLYGEGGRSAFRRLQQEIMAQYTDTSLFAWGEIIRSNPTQDSSVDAPLSRQVVPVTQMISEEHARHDDRYYLLAPSVQSFSYCNIAFAPLGLQGTSGQVPSVNSQLFIL